MVLHKNVWIREVFVGLLGVTVPSHWCVSSINNPDYIQRLVNQCLLLSDMMTYLSQMRVDYYLLMAFVDCLGNSEWMTNLVAPKVLSSGGYEATDHMIIGDLVATCYWAWRCAFSVKLWAKYRQGKFWTEFLLRTKVEKYSATWLFL